MLGGSVTDHKIDNHRSNGVIFFPVYMTNKLLSISAGWRSTLANH